MKLRLFFASYIMVMAMPLLADVDVDPQNVGSERITQPAKQTPFSFNTHVDVISGAKITKGFYKGDMIHYAEAEVEAGMIVYYCPTFTEGARVAIGFSPTYMGWKENPWFEQDHFNIVSFTVAGFTKRMDRWFWRTQLTANFDAERWSCQYTSYDWILWGRYEYCKHIGVHFGFWAETGLRMDRVYPILGFDWQISKKIKLNLVYPVDVSCMYSLNARWSLGAAGRFFNSRFRVHHDQHSRKPLVRYNNVGAEFIVNYQNDSVNANAHVGSTLGGYYRVADKSNNHAQRYIVGSSFYAGAEMDVKF